MATRAGPGFASLYVGDLHNDVTEAALFNTFCVVGPIQSIRVVRDTYNNRSLGYAYVNFHTTKDAERALDTLNYTKIIGQPCRIMWAQRGKDARKRRKEGLGNIIVCNLDKSIDDRTLLDTFSMFGDILSCKVAVDRKTNLSKGFGFVHYANPNDAKKAIEKVNGMEIGDKKVFVSDYQSREEREKILSSKFTNCYLKDFPVDWDDDKLKEICKEFGTVTSASVSRDKEGKSKGFGFVTFDKHEEAIAAVEALNGKEFGEGEAKTPLHIGRFMNKKERAKLLKKEFLEKKKAASAEAKEKNLFVKNLDPSVDDAELKKMFDGHGSVKAAKVMCTPDGKSKGFGFVSFEEVAGAREAVKALNGKEVKGKKIGVEVTQTRKKNYSPGGGASNWYKGAGRGGGGGASNYSFYQTQGYGGYPNYGAGRQGWGHYGFVQASPYQGRAGGYYAAGGGMRRGGYHGKGNRGGATGGAAGGHNSAHQKQLIGEKIFPRVQVIDMKRAGKITGMLLEMDIKELLSLMQAGKESAFEAKVHEAQLVLKKAQQE